MIANKLNVIKRVEKAAPLTYEEMDTNLNELINVITDVIDNRNEQNQVNVDLQNKNDDQDLILTSLTDDMPTKVNIADIVDALNSTDGTKVLSANQGKILYDMLQANNATIVRYNYNVAQGQTVVGGADINGKSLSYVPAGVMLVNFNGFDLWLGDDYTATNGTSITLTSAAEVAGQLSITTFGSFSATNHYTKAEDDVFLNNRYTKAESNALELSGFPALPLASATSTNIGAVASEVVNITGTTTITAFGTAPDGMRKTLRFSAALVLTHNATSLILLGSANIATAAGDSCTMLSLGAGNWIMLDYQRADGRALAFAYDKTNVVGAVSIDGSFNNNGALMQTYVSGTWNVDKFANGLMIMSCEFSAVNPAGNTYVNTQFAIPEPFSAFHPVRGAWSLRTNNNGATSGLIFISVSGTTCTVQHCFNVASTSTVEIILIGRWKA